MATHTIVAALAALAGVATAAHVATSPTPTAGSAVKVVTAGTATPAASPAAARAANQAAAIAAMIAAQGAARQAVTQPALAPLAPLDLRDMALWNWGGKWMASEWGNGNSPLPWRYDHVRQPSGGDTYFTLDQNGAPELQALDGTTAVGRGLWEADVTLPALRDGLIVAPLWLYDRDSRDEVDFEFVGRRGLDVTMHAYVNGVHQQNTVRLYAGQDWSGQRHRFGIKADETGGYVEMYVDGKRVQRWDRGSMPFFISHPVKPWIEMWAASPDNTGFVQWAGSWPGLGKGELLTMTVHGYGYTPLP